MKLAALCHVAFETPAMIAEWASERGHELKEYHLYRGDALPAGDAFDGLIIMGGPMSVHDSAEHPWLEAEKQCIHHAIKHKKHIVGVCLGAQLIAEAMGAHIQRMEHKEIGWHPIAFSDAIMGHPLIAKLNTAMEVFHWHGEAFTMPEGATPLASSQACAIQGFWHESAILALQCHLEMDETSIARICDACADELDETSPHIQTHSKITRNIKAIPAMRRALFHMLDYWAEVQPK